MSIRIRGIHPSDLPDDEDIYIAHNRLRTVKPKDNLPSKDSDNLPDWIVDRLAHARDLAMDRYREKWA